MQDPVVGSRPRYALWIIFGLVLALVVAVRIRLLQVPLERDEGEYAYAGQLLLKGYPLYSQAYNMKMPGIYVAYSILMSIFGQTPSGIHLGLLLLNLVTILLVFLLARRLLDLEAAVVSAIVFALMSLSRGILGFTANAEMFILPAALGGILCLLRGLDSQRKWELVAGGVFLGLGLLIKQHGVFFLLFAAVYLVLRREMKSMIWAATGVLLPCAVLVVYLLATGMLDRFWFWTIRYAYEYVSAVPVAQGVQFYFPSAFRSVTGACIPFWIFALIGLDASLFWDEQSRKQALFFLLFLIFSAMSVLPGFYFREHYFILVLPAVAIYGGIGIRALSRLPSVTLRDNAYFRLIAFLLIGLSYTLLSERLYFFQWTPQQVSRITYGPNPFTESVVIAGHLREHTTEKDRVVVFGSEPQIYFYARRLSATGFIYTYPVMEEQKFAQQMQRQMIAEIEAGHPEYLVDVHIPSSGVEPVAESIVPEWLAGYEKQFTREGLVAIDCYGRGSRFFWGEQAREIQMPPNSCWISILKRKD